MYSLICMLGSKAEERLSIELTEVDLGKWDPIAMRLLDRSSPANFILNKALEVL